MKYSTMELNKEIVIIPKEGESISYKSSEEDHSDLLKKFVIDNNVNIDNVDKNDLTITGPFCEFIAKQGYSVMILEGLYTCVYLPEKVSINQYEFYDRIKKVLFFKSFHYGYIEDGELIESNGDEKNSKRIKTFYKHMKDSLEREGMEHGHRTIS